MAFRTITVGRLKNLLDGEDDNKRVIFSTDYGDYHHTPQALGLYGEIEEAFVKPTGYSNSGFEVVTEDDEDFSDYDGESYLLIR